MALNYIGEITIGALCPLVVSANLPAYKELNARLTGALALQASLAVTPPSIPSTIAAIEAFLANLNASVAAGVPSVSFNVAACAALVTDATAAIGFLRTLQGLFATGGIFVYTYDGPANALGGTLDFALATGWPDGSFGSTPSNAIVLGTHSSATWADMLAFFGGA